MSILNELLNVIFNRFIKDKSLIFHVFISDEIGETHFVAKDLRTRINKDCFSIEARNFYIRDAGSDLEITIEADLDFLIGEE